MLPDGCGCISAAGNGHKVQPADSRGGTGKEVDNSEGDPNAGTSRPWEKDQPSVSHCKHPSLQGSFPSGASPPTSCVLFPQEFAFRGMKSIPQLIRV